MTAPKVLRSLVERHNHYPIFSRLEQRDVNGLLSAEWKIYACNSCDMWGEVETYPHKDSKIRWFIKSE